MTYKLRSSVSVVDLDNNCLEFFKTNIRESIKINTQSSTIKQLVLNMDGKNTLEELADRFNFDCESTSTQNLIIFLKKNAILSNDYLVKQRPDYNKYRRTIHFIEDYSKSDNDLLEMWNNIRNSRVVIIGLGAVGSWVATNLVQSGVKNLVLVDKDIVELSNLHRQYGYTENDVGKKKTEVLKKRLLEFEDDLNIDEYNMFLDENNLFSITGKIDLVINCADKPNVDQTSKWVGNFCMAKNIPHIVGGGYNLHLSLVGQTIIPFESACVNCFEEQLKKINNIDGENIKKLNIKNRKIGSFGPMCTLIASMIGMEAIKVLSKKIKPDNINRRGDFNIYNMDLKYSTFEKLENCCWCGKENIYERN